MKFSLLAILLAQISISQCFAVIPDSTILKGRVIDTKTQEPVDSELDIYYNSDFILDDVQLSHHGEYVEKLKHYGLYIITITAPGYLDVTDTLWVIDETKKEITKDFHLTPIEVGLTVVLNNIYFHFGTTMLKPESTGSLDKVVAFFQANANIRFEIAGHTDDEGADDYNLALSLGRAQAVVDYMVKAGIDSSRLTAEGYGESKPIDKGITKAAKAKNRRVEFIVRDIEKGSR
jgi:outer membrane protein OmpA-like peptidoglycan-associated protein